MARWMGKFGGNPLLHRIIESCESTFILWVCILFLLVACFFLFASSPILAIRWQRSKCLIGLWQGLERFPCHLYHLRSPAVSSSSSSVNMVASAYIKKLWWSWGGGANIPAAWHRPHWGWGYPACLQEHLRCHDVSLTSTAGRWSTPMLSLGPHAIWVFPNSKSSFHSTSTASASLETTDR